MGFTLIDLLIFVILVLYCIAGFRRGFFISLGTLAGLIAGGYVAYFAVPWVSQQVSIGWHLIALIFTFIFCLLVGQWLGYVLGSVLRRPLDATPLRGLERFAGGALNLLVGLLVVLSTALVLKPLGISPVTDALNKSQLVSWLSANTPVEVEDTLTSLRTNIISSQSIPKVSNLLFPTQPAPRTKLENAALEQASQSVLEIMGTAQGCNYVSEGSGFVADSNYVVTNAHVVEGVESPTVQDRSGKSYPAQTVYFDKTADIAILSISGGTFTPLALGDDVAAGTTVSFMGYPGGGPFTARPASVQGLGYTQTVNSETGETNPSRLVYQLAAQVEQGNSGGPVLTEEGKVVGIIFAKAVQGETGYAIPASTLKTALSQVSATPVSTGRCQLHTSANN